tara:strand:- start:464 stop:1717 length:1254 start_codon:yes stop_codon:yes gene_type:complete
MLLVYRILINFILILSPLILIFRLLKKKENFKRFKEKFCLFTKKKNKGNLIWFHGASVGELQSIVPLIEILEKDKRINQILLTSNTLSSSKIVKKLNFKKITHQFFPIDSYFLAKKFINYWKPSLAFFIDSEIWPNMLNILSKKKIKTCLINGRITKKTFKRWKILPNFSNQIFNKFDLCFASSKQSKNYLDKLGIKKNRFIGNLKFSQSENDKIILDKKLRSLISSRKSWCASSTHHNEEKLCGLAHKELKKKYKNLITIIIPRHIERANSINEELKELNLKTHLDEPKKKINKKIDVYIVNSYGKTKAFYSACKNIFLGGSIVHHGGQNPLEATRYGCNILHGPNIENFKEIYNFLKVNKISRKIKNQNEMINILDECLKKKGNSKKIQKKLNIIGEKILFQTYKEINLLIKNEI